MDKKGCIAIISGPSGVGKSTICKAVLEKIDASLSVSATTRPQSPDEVDGKDYWFLSEEQFRAKERKGEFLETAEVFGNRYGTLQDKVEEELEDGKVVMLEIDVQGALNVKRIYPEALMIFILPPKHDDLAERMMARARGEDEETARKRLDQASSEIATAWQYYEHMVINDDLDHAIEEVKQIIETSIGKQK